MGLLSFLKRQGSAQPAEAAAASTPDAVVVARTQARRRLIGAAVLLAIGVIGFPLLFETQPRPIAVDIPISIPNKDRAAPLVLAPAPAASIRPQAPAEPMETTERQADQGREMPAPATAASVTATPASAAAAVATNPPVQARASAAAAAQTEPQPGPAPQPTVAKSEPVAAPAASKPAAAASKPATATASSAAKKDADRAQALLDGKSSASDEVARVVVQVGAYTEPEKMRQARSKLEGLGFKTYTQAVDVGGERRIRVRVGPFSNRAEADKAAARIKAAGLPAAILTL